MMGDMDDPRTMRLLEKALVTLPHIQSSAIIADDEGIHWKVIHETASLVHGLTEHSLNSQARLSSSPCTPGSLKALVSVWRRPQVGKFMGVDPTPAPLGDVSIGAAIESYTGAKFGSSDTMTAALAITTAVKAVPVKQVGYSGLMVPVMEDQLLAKRWAEGAYNTDDLLAYSAVCGTGLDTVPFPGDISQAQMERIYGDVASLAWKWQKPLSARLQPVAGKRAGDRTPFSSQFLFNTTLHAVP